MSVSDENRKEVQKLIDAFKNRAVKVHTGLQKAINTACLLVEREAKQSMYNTTTWTEHGYKRGNKIHYPSMPGQPPAVDTARLVQSITHRIENTFNPTGYVGTKLSPYPRMLEEGTSKMARRPWLGPALDKNRERIKELLGEAVSGKIVAGGE
jgi:hypothetical protein